MSHTPLLAQAKHATVSVLMYHQVAPFAEPTEHRACFCHVDRFKSQMRYLKYTGYDVISLDKARRALFENQPLSKRSVVLTFDDGCDNFRQHAWPILQEFGFCATMFVMPELLGKTTAWMKAPYSDEPLMTAAQIIQLQSEGMHFGSHTLTHCRLAEASDEQSRQEIFESKLRLEDVLQRPVEDLCYPYGSYSQREVRFTQEAGYQTGLTCRRGHGNFSPNPFEITRKAISYGDSALGLGFKLIKSK